MSNGNRQLLFQQLCPSMIVTWDLPVCVYLFGHVIYLCNCWYYSTVRQYLHETYSSWWPAYVAIYLPAFSRRRKNRIWTPRTYLNMHSLHTVLHWAYNKYESALHQTYFPKNNNLRLEGTATVHVAIVESHPKSTQKLMLESRSHLQSNGQTLTRTLFL